MSKSTQSIISEKYNKEKWTQAEKKISQFDMKIIQTLVGLGKKTTVEHRQELISMGNQLYLIIRDNLVSADIKLIKDKILVEEFEKEPKKKGGKKHNPQKLSAEDIKIKNSQQRAKKEVQTIFDSFSPTDFRPQLAFNSDIVEIKGIGLMYGAWFLLNNVSKFKKTKSYPIVLGIIVAIQKFLNASKGFEGRSMIQPSSMSQISSQLICDLDDWLTKLLAEFKYSGMIVCGYAPELIIYTDYDKAIPSLGICPRTHQVQLLDFFESNLENGFLCVYNPMIGAGKTTNIASLASSIERLRVSDSKKYGMLHMFFVCNLESVMDHAASICFNAGIRFAIAGRDPRNDKYKIVNSFNCKTAEERIVIICSSQIGFEIINDYTLSERQNVLVFHDEPTIGSDSKDSDTLKQNISLLTIPTKYMIESSATFPEIGLIKPIISSFCESYPKANIGTVYSDEIQIGCNIYNFDGEMVVPHLGVRTASEMKLVIQSIRKSPFLGRNYTPEVVRSLSDAMQILKISDIPDINQIFSNVVNLSSNKVRQVAMQLLCILSEQPDSVVEKVCRSKITDTKDNLGFDEVVAQPDKTVSFWDTEDDSDDPASVLDYSLLVTKQAYRFQNTTLIATDDPEKFVLKHMINFIKEIYQTDVGGSEYKSTANIMSKYQRDVEIWEKDKLPIIKNTKDEEKLSQRLQEHEELKPKIKFPAFAHIGTAEHISRYAGTNSSLIYKKFVRTPIDLSEIPSDMLVSDEILTALYSGIGIYGKNVCPQYMACVLRLASEGKLAYLIADDTICFGTNYPISNVICTEEFGTQHSTNTLFQLFGRAGRVGRSWIANVYVTNNIAKKIIDYVHNRGDSEQEARNMCDIFEKLVVEKKLSDQRKIDIVMSKYMQTPQITKSSKVFFTQSNPVIQSSSIDDIKAIPTPLKHTLIPISQVVEQPIVCEAKSSKSWKDRLSQSDNMSWRSDKQEVKSIPKYQVKKSNTDVNQQSWRRNG